MAQISDDGQDVAVGTCAACINSLDINPSDPPAA
jgi:hypothetical protein